MKTDTSDQLTKFFRYLLLSVAVCFIAVYLILAFLRIRYPFELEWMEGACVDHVLRILSGEKLYVTPSLEFIPFIYAPLYFYLSAAVSAIIGVGFLPLRLVSLISSLGCLSLIFFFVKKETGSGLLGILASSLFAATYRISGAWYDIGRADSLFLLLLLGGLYLIKFRHSSKSYLLAGVLVSLSFLTKQVALIIFLPTALYCVLSGRARSTYFIGTVVGIVGVSTYLLNWIHGGWYSYYVFHLPRQHVVVEGMYLDFWTKDILSALPVACAISAFFIFAQTVISGKRNYLFYSLMSVGMLGGAWLTRLRLGSYDNVLIPAYAVLSILFGLGIHRAFDFISGASAIKRRVLEAGICLVCITQFLLLVYNPLAQIPTRKDLEAGRGFIDTMAQLPGDVLVLSHGYLPTLAGKRSHAHDAAVNDVLNDTGSAAAAKLREEIRRAVQERRFGAIILDGPWFLEIIQRHYDGHRALFASADVFWPATGRRTRPEMVYLPKSDAAD
ncbi:MAG: glycosyltransferase family 39 protein [Candidatus Zixiibacteriota bacterium]|nr:MAG: glycosyltransferase family 39 protein [candidate division Zixibacteria bacterium]